MKKHGKLMFFPVLICLLIVSASFAQYKVTLVEQRGSDIVINFALSQYQVMDVVVNGESCNYIHIPGVYYPAAKGLPDLPRMSKSVLIPNNADMGLEIVDIQYKELAVKKLVPSKGMIYRSQNPADVAYTFGTIYGDNAWYPQTAAYLGRPFILRDVRGIAVYFQPISYNPALGKIKIAESITVKVKSIGVGKVNVLNSVSDKISPTFDKIYNHHFLNYASTRTRYPAVGEGDKMIVISPSKFNTNIQPFIDWKNKKGIKTTLYEYPTATGTGETALKAFILDKYTKDKISYILLVGDHADIPAVNWQGSDAAHESDPSYVLLAGDDRHADAFIGRFSSTAAADITNMVNKAVKYESQPDAAGTWYEKACGIASNEGTPKDWEWMNDFRDSLMKYNYTTVDKVYDPGATAAQVSTSINAGVSLVNYMGHGNYNVWGTSMYGPTNVTALTNGDKLPIIINSTCYVGQFKQYTCMGEVFTKTANKGAIIFLGASNSQPWNPPQIGHQEMISLICQDKYISAGAIIYNGMMKMVEDCADGDDTYEAWTHFGDPSLMPFTKKPATLTVTSPTDVAGGTQKVNISFGTKIDGRVCLFNATNKSVAGCAFVNDANSVTVDAVIPAVDKLTLVVTARNCMPYEKEITVSSSSINSQSDMAKNLKIQSYPNPFSITTRISFRNEGKNAVVSIYSSTGKQIVSESVIGNCYTWNAENQTSGLYIVRIKTNSGLLEKSMYLIK